MYSIRDNWELYIPVGQKEVFWAFSWQSASSRPATESEGWAVNPHTESWAWYTGLENLGHFMRSRLGWLWEVLPWASLTNRHDYDKKKTLLSSLFKICETHWCIFPIESSWNTTRLYGWNFTWSLLKAHATEVASFSWSLLETKH